MTDICSDIDSLRRLVKSAGWQRIGIDGVDGAGKTHLATYLSEELGMPMLSVDDYLYQNQGGYIDFVDYPALGAACTAMPAYILYGVCLREVLERMQIELDANIYIKRMQQDFWVDEERCVFPDGVEEAISAAAEQFDYFSRMLDEPNERVVDLGEENPSHVPAEVMRYHDAYAPQDSADVVFEQEVKGG
jgi:hypothetical protein